MHDRTTEDGRQNQSANTKWRGLRDYKIRRSNTYTAAMVKQALANAIEDTKSSEYEKEDNMHEAESDSDPDRDEAPVRPMKKQKVHKLTLTETENFNEKLRKRGVVFIARIPPRMTPTKVKSLLSEFGEITRVYLVEEDATVRKRRKKERGSSGGKRYIEGWVEFASKRKAKHVATSLNTTPISNQKRNPHHGKFI